MRRLLQNPLSSHKVMIEGYFFERKIRYILYEGKEVLI